MRSGMSPLHSLNYIILQWSKPTSNPIAKKKIKKIVKPKIFLNLLTSRLKRRNFWPVFQLIDEFQVIKNLLLPDLHWGHAIISPFLTRFIWDSLDARIPPVLYGQLQTIVPTGLRCSEQHTQTAGICGQDQCLQRQWRSSFCTKQSRPGRVFLTISEGPQNKGFPLLPSTWPAHRSDSTAECRPAELLFYD